MEVNKSGNSKEIAGYLKDGKVLACPTDTVYGLICDAGNESAVERIFEIKKREKLKPLAVFVKNTKMAKKFAEIGKEAEEFLKDNKITTILKAKNQNLSKLVYKNGTIGIRIPKYELLNLILEKFGKPIAQTSANLSGRPTTIKIKEVLEQFKDEDIIIIDGGDLPENKPSKVVNLFSGEKEILRY